MDVNHGGIALLTALPIGHGQPMYLTGLAVHRASGTYRGEGKSDAKDAVVIADQARARRDLGILRILPCRRLDPVFDRTRQTNRSRVGPLEVFSALERERHLADQCPLVLLTGFQTPAAVHRTAPARLDAWLRKRTVRCGAALACTAVDAACSQDIELPGQDLAARTPARLAQVVLALVREIADLDQLIERKLAEHPYSTAVRSPPGMGAKLTAEYIAATGGRLELFGNAGRLSGNLR